MLAEALGSSQHVSYRNLATSGATAPAVLQDQLPASGTGRIDVASLVVGVNDTMRSSFDADRIRDCLLACADQLSRRGALLLTVRFHDHGQVFGLPGWLRRPLWRRIELVNAAYDQVQDRYGGIRVDLDDCPDVYRREFWSVDRLHPGERGHRRLARTFADELLALGFPIATPPTLDCNESAAPTRWDDARWMIREGAPWLARRTKDLTPWALRLALTHHSPQIARRVGDCSPQPALATAPEPPPGQVVV